MASIENAFRNYVEYPYDGQSLARSRRNAAEKPTEIGLPFASHTPHRFRKWEFDDGPAQIPPSEFFLKKQIIHLLQINSYRLDEGEFNELYPSALTALENLFTSGEGNAFRKWSAMEFRLKTIIGLRAGLLKFYGAGYPMVHPIDSMPKNSLSAANFDLIYMQFLIKHLLSYLDVNKVKEKLTRPAQLLAFIGQTEGFPVSTDIFLQTDIDQLGASQRRHLDLAALLDNYSHQGNAFSATPTNMRESLETLRDNFIARLNQDVKIHQIIDRVLDPIIKHPADPRYDTIAFVNATGKNFDYFKDRVVSEATRQGLGLTPAALKAATKRYFNSLGESTQFTIGTLEHSLHSICLRYDGFFKKTPLALPPTLAQLKEQLEHYDRLWEASDKPGSVMKPSVMAGLHLMHSRGVCFVDTDWGARLWEKTIKAEVAAILKEEQAQWSNCAELPFSDLSQNAADAFKAFSSFKMVDTGKTECVSTILTMGENRSLLAIKNRKIQVINERIQALREKYLATERLSSDGDPVKELAMAQAYLKEWINSQLEPQPVIDAKDIALKILQRRFPGKPDNYFTESVIEEVRVFEPLLSPIALMVSRVDHFISEAKSYSDSDERLEFNKEIDNFITDNKIWIKARARTNLRITGGVFGDAELQAEVHKVIQVILANKIQPDHDYDIAGILLSLIPFIGSAELLYEGARNNNLMEFLSGALFLSLDTLMFINSPLRAAMTPEELTIEASSRTNDLQSVDEKIQLKSLAHVSKQLHADNDVIENLFKNRELIDNTQHILKEPGFCLVPPEQKALAQEVIQEANKADSAPKLWRGHKVVLLEKEQRVIPITDFPGVGKVEVSWHTAAPVFPLRPIHQFRDGKFLATRWLNGIPEAARTSLSSAEQWLHRQVVGGLDEIDREFAPTGMQSDPVVTDTIGKLQLLDLRQELSAAEAQGLLSTIFRYQGDLSVSHLVYQALQTSIANTLDLAAQRSPIFRRLLQIRQESGAKPIYFDLSDKHLYPRAYPLLTPEINNGLEEVAKEDLRQQAKHDYIVMLKQGNPTITTEEIDSALLSRAAKEHESRALQRSFIDERVTVLRKKHQLVTIDVPSVEKIRTLRYFSSDGEHPFTLAQSIFHELVHTITGLKDISSRVISGLSLAAKGVGAVDHLTDLILFEIGEDIPMRVVYGTEELKQSVSVPTARSVLLKNAFHRTEAQRRVIDGSLKNLIQQANEQSVIFSTPINQRTTVAQAGYFESQKKVLLRGYSAERKETEFKRIIDKNTGLLNVDLGALPDPLRMAYETDFQDLLTKSRTMVDSSLMWWNKNGHGTDPWKIIVESINGEMASGFEPVSIDQGKRLVSVRHHEQLVYLSEHGIKPLETSRLAALTLQKLFNHPFASGMPGAIKLDERGGEVYRANQALAEINRSKLQPQISYLITGSKNPNKEKLLLKNSDARLAAWKENTFLTQYTQ